MSLRHPKITKRRVSHSPTKGPHLHKHPAAHVPSPHVSVVDPLPSLVIGPTTSADKTATQLVPSDGVHRRRPYGSAHLSIQREEVVVLPGYRATYAQPLDVGKAWSLGHQGAAHAHLDPPTMPEAIYDEDSLINQLHVTTQEATGPIELRQTHRHMKKQRQWSKWADIIIPALLKPYIHLLQETQSLHDHVVEPGFVSCQCGNTHTVLQVTCVYFDSESLCLYNILY